jgi:PiT family inorganic phosphate transporter
VLIVSWIFVRQTPFAVDRTFRILQFVSASLYSLGHGGNDAQKTMGIIAILLYSQGYLGGSFHVPLWVVLSCQSAMALGTLFGGWRIVHTMGSKITTAQSDAGVLRGNGRGADAVRRDLAGHSGLDHAYDHRRDHRRRRRTAVSAVRWGLAGNIVIAWVVTLPAAALISAAFYWIADIFA